MQSAMSAKLQDRLDKVVVPAAGRLLFWLAGGFVAALALLITLPDRDYIKVQALSQTIHNRVQWSYERIHFDPTPIDIAVIGNSRMGAGVNAPALSAALSQQLGRPVHVVNLSTPQEGRNTHFLMAREVLEARPELSLILMSVIEQEPRVSHPAFASLAGRGDILTAPLLLNRDWLNDVAHLPFRQLSLFVKGLLPGAFGMQGSFDPAFYSGPDYDTTLSFTVPDGGFVDRDTVPEEATLRRIATARLAQVNRPLLPAAYSDYEFVVERDYTRKIADLTAAKGLGLGFIYLPIYTNTAQINNRSFYSDIGPVYEARQLIEAPALFSDYGHLNHAGASTIVPWLADQIGQSLAAQDFALKPPQP